jgi:hypothetical protein
MSVESTCPTAEPGVVNELHALLRELLTGCTGRGAQPAGCHRQRHLLMINPIDLHRKTFHDRWVESRGFLNR